MDTKRQIIKSSTSSGANYEESQGSPTKPDVKTKIGISLKEMRESNYFLRIYSRLKLGDVEKNTYLVNESSELKRILASILNKLSISFFFFWALVLELGTCPTSRRVWGFIHTRRYLRNIS